MTDAHSMALRIKINECKQLIVDGTEKYSKLIVALIEYKNAGKLIRKSISECKTIAWDCNRDQLPNFAKSVLHDVELYQYGSLTRHFSVAYITESGLNKTFKEFNKVIDISAILLYDTGSVPDDHPWLELKNLEYLAINLKEIVDKFDPSNYPDLEQDNIKTHKSNGYRISDLDSQLTNYVRSDWFKSGFYYNNGQTYRIRRTGSNANFEVSYMVVPAPGKTPMFVEAPYAIIKKLIFINPMSQQEVLDLSHQHKFCAICGRPIEVKESVERGMGPVCAERLKNMDIDTNKAKGVLA